MGEEEVEVILEIINFIIIESNLIFDFSFNVIFIIGDGEVDSWMVFIGILENIN